MNSDILLSDNINLKLYPFIIKLRSHLTRSSVELIVKYFD